MPREEPCPDLEHDREHPDSLGAITGRVVVDERVGVHPALAVLDEHQAQRAQGGWDALIPFASTAGQWEHSLSGNLVSSGGWWGVAFVVGLLGSIHDLRLQMADRFGARPQCALTRGEQDAVASRFPRRRARARAARGASS